MKLYEELINKLDYAKTKLENISYEFWHERKETNFTKNVDVTEKLDNDLLELDTIIYNGEAVTRRERDLVMKYKAIADEFRSIRQFNV